MAGSLSEEYGAVRSLEGISSGQRCQSGEALAEWRCSEQVENGTPSTSPPYWDTDDDYDCGMLFIYLNLLFACFAFHLFHPLLFVYPCFPFRLCLPLFMAT